MRGADDAELLLVHQFLQHLQNAALVGNRERHFGFVEQQRGAVRQLGKGLAEHGEHDLPVAGGAQEFHHFRLFLEEFQLGARIVLFRVEEVGLAGLDVAGFETVDVAIHFVAAQGVEDGVQQRRFPRPVLALKHDQGMREVHNHRHVEIQVDENRMPQNLKMHSVPG